MSTLYGKDYLGSTIVCKSSISGDDINSKSSQVVFGKDYLGSTFVSKQQEQSSGSSNAKHCDGDIILGKDYLGSTFVSVQSSNPLPNVKFAASSTPQIINDANHSGDSNNNNVVLGTDYLGSTIVARESNFNPANSSYDDDTLKSVAGNIVKDCVSKASEVLNKENEECSVDVLGKLN